MLTLACRSYLLFDFCLFNVYPPPRPWPAPRRPGSHLLGSPPNPQCLAQQTEARTYSVLWRKESKLPISTFKKSPWFLSLNKNTSSFKFSQYTSYTFSLDTSKAFNTCLTPSHIFLHCKILAGKDFIFFIFRLPVPGIWTALGNNCWNKWMNEQHVWYAEPEIRVLVTYRRGAHCKFKYG